MSTLLIAGPDSDSSAPNTGTSGTFLFFRRYGWVARRLVLAVVVLIVASIAVFAITTVLPGDAARTILGEKASEAQLAAVRSALGLDRGPVTRYLSWAGGVLQGNWGTSLVTHLPVSEIIAAPLRNSIILVLLSCVTVVPTATVIGILAATKPKGLFDSAWNGISVALAAIPDFVLGIILVTVFSTGVLHWLPAVAVVRPGSSPLQNPAGLVLPSATLALVVLPYLSRLIRASIVDALNSEYVLLARLEGIPERVVLFRHAASNCVVPLVEGILTTVVVSFGGVVLIEYLFQYPGLGRVLADSVVSRDLPVLQAVVLIFAAIGIASHLLADLLAVILTPRLRTA